MYNLPEYIAARRATSIVKSFIIDKRTYTASSEDGPEDITMNLANLDFSSVNKELVFINAKLKKLIEICSPGAICKRFLFVEPATNIIIPLFLFETFEPSHCYIPIVITNRSILMISPFGVSYKGNIEWIRELMPTFTLSDCKTAEDLEKNYFRLSAKIPAIPKTIFLNRLYDGTPIVLDENISYTKEVKLAIIDLARNICTIDFNEKTKKKWLFF